MVQHYVILDGVVVSVSTDVTKIKQEARQMLQDHPGSIVETQTITIQKNRIV